MKEELCGKVLEVKIVSDRVMAIVFAFEQDVLSLICWHSSQNGRSFEKQSFMIEK